MPDEFLFRMKNPANQYTAPQIVELIGHAECLGYPIEKGSYLEKMTVHQLANLLYGHTDA